MNVSYITTDEVNAALAVRFAARCGVAVTVADPRGLSAFSWPAMVCDLDAVPGGFACLKRVAVAGRLWAVHSYNLTRGQAKALRAAGVIVCRRLTTRLFRRLMALRTAAAGEGV
jgi:hypothetical protein